MGRLIVDEEQETITLNRDLETNKKYASGRQFTNQIKDIRILISKNNCTISYQPPSGWKFGSYANAVDFNQSHSSFVDEFSKIIDNLLKIANKALERCNPDKGKIYMR